MKGLLGLRNLDIICGSRPQGTRRKMDRDAILHLKGISRLDHQILNHTLEGSSSEENNQT
jgi:hypothetical protein